jgi:hypothetical protein
VRADHHAVLDDQAVDLVAEGEPDASGRHVLADASLERCDDAGAGAPRQVEAGHGVAVALGPPVATLRPADDREQS